MVNSIYLPSTEAQEILLRDPDWAGCWVTLRPLLGAIGDPPSPRNQWAWFPEDRENGGRSPAGLISLLGLFPAVGRHCLSLLWKQEPSEELWCKYLLTTLADQNMPPKICLFGIWVILSKGHWEPADAGKVLKTGHKFSSCKGNFHLWKVSLSVWYQEEKDS